MLREKLMQEQRVMWYQENYTSDGQKEPTYYISFNIENEHNASFPDLDKKMDISTNLTK